MKILGLQKVTLIDYPGKIACTFFLFGCNFRCGFCHNPSLVFPSKDSVEISKQEALDYLKSKKNYLDGVCFTGGEPLLSMEDDFLKEIKNLGYLIKIDTNGSFPEKLQKLIDKGFVDFVAMDIKNSKEKYFESTRVKVDLKKIEKSIKAILKLEDYEFRTTIVNNLHEKEDIEKIGKWVNELSGKKPRKYVLQGFKKQGEILDESFKKIPDTKESTLKEMKEIAEKYFEEVEIRV